MAPQLLLGLLLVGIAWVRLGLRTIKWNWLLLLWVPTRMIHLTILILQQMFGSCFIVQMAPVSPEGWEPGVMCGQRDWIRKVSRGNCGGKMQRLQIISGFIARVFTTALLKLHSIIVKFSTYYSFLCIVFHSLLNGWQSLSAWASSYILLDSLCSPFVRVRGLHF